MTGLRYLAIVAAATALVALPGCQWFDRTPAIILDETDLRDARGQLYPQWLIAQDFQPVRPEALNAWIGERLTRLTATSEDIPELEFVITREADADAGCMAGGRLFISQGLLAWVEYPDELDALLALALAACSQASDYWRKRHRGDLLPLEHSQWLMNRYRDFRLKANSGFYNQLVAVGCGRGIHCDEQARQSLFRAGLEDSGLHRLRQRVLAQWPDAAWLSRFPGAEPSPVGSGRQDPELDKLLDVFRARREGLGHAREIRRHWHAGELREAYRAQIRTRRRIDDDWLVMMNQIRLDLTNFHPDYAQRDMQRMSAQFGDHPEDQYWWGRIDTQLRRTPDALTRLNNSLDTLPRVSTHFYLARLLDIGQSPEQAVSHYRQIMVAGPIHPYHERAAARLLAANEEK